MKKFLALVLSLCMVFSLAAVASAAEIDADGGSGSTPVYLSSTADGSIGGDPAPTAMSVTPLLMTRHRLSPFPLRTNIPLNLRMFPLNTEVRKNMP